VDHYWHIDDGNHAMLSQQIRGTKLISRSNILDGDRRSRLEKHDRTLRRWIGAQADLTLGELQRRCLEQLKVSIGLTALWHRLEQLGLSYKKNDARRRARSAGR